jgi:hypothetical protein
MASLGCKGLTEVAIPNSYTILNNITNKLQKCTDLKEGFIGAWRMKRLL